QIYAAFVFRWFDLGGNARSLLERLLGKIDRHFKLAHGNLDFHAGIVNFPQHFNHTPQRLTMALGLLSNLYRHNLTGLGLALVSVGNQDVVLDTLIFGHHDERATFPQETAHQLAGVARSNFDDRGIWL